MRNASPLRHSSFVFLPRTGTTSLSGSWCVAPDLLTAGADEVKERTPMCRDASASPWTHRLASGRRRNRTSPCGRGRDASEVSEPPTSLIRVVGIARSRITRQDGVKEFNSCCDLARLECDPCTPQRAISSHCSRISRGAHRLRGHESAEQWLRRGGRLHANRFDVGKPFLIQQHRLKISACSAQSVGAPEPSKHLLGRSSLLLKEVCDLATGHNPNETPPDHHLFEHRDPLPGLGLDDPSRVLFVISASHPSPPIDEVPRPLRVIT